MTAATRFENLLKIIEESNLNYSIHKGACPKKKCSFVKRFSNMYDDYSTTSQQCQQNSEGTEKLEFEKLKEENYAFKKELSELRDGYDNEKGRLEDLFKSEKEKFKDAEKQIAELCEEVLNVKRDKHEISADLKLVESSLSASEIQTNQLNLKVVSVICVWRSFPALKTWGRH
jgi:chromosome segregation ATPase